MCVHARVGVCLAMWHTNTTQFHFECSSTRHHQKSALYKMTLKQKTDIRFGIACKLNGRQSQKVLSHFFLLSDTISTAKKKKPKGT